MHAVEEVVATLTAAAGAGYGGTAALRAGMRRAADEFDETAATALARSLVDSLCKNPDDIRILESLVILGLAHPGALEQHRISLESEARRLAVLLERLGHYERAYCLGELVAERVSQQQAIEEQEQEQDDAVQNLVRDAEFAAARGRTQAAVRCLEEARRLDPEREDIAATIRELWRKREYRKAHALRALKIAFFATLLSGATTAFALREHRIWRAWKTIPEAGSGTLPAMRERLEGIESLLERERYWLTMPLAYLERDLLLHDIALQARPVPPAVTDVPGAMQEIVENPFAKADEARKLGLEHAEKGRMLEALVELERALEIAPPGWVHRRRTEANVAALRLWKERTAGEAGP